MITLQTPCIEYILLNLNIFTSLTKILHSYFSQSFFDFYLVILSQSYQRKCISQIFYTYFTVQALLFFFLPQTPISKVIFSKKKKKN